MTVRIYPHQTYPEAPSFIVLHLHSLFASHIWHILIIFLVLVSLICVTYQTHVTFLDLLALINM